MARLFALALVLLAGSSPLAIAQQTPATPPASADVPAAAPVDLARREEPAPFQWGASVLAVADFVPAGNGDEIIDIPSYGGVGFDLHLGALLTSRIGWNGVRFSLIAGYRGNAEFKWGFEAIGIPNDLFTQRHQAYIAVAGNSAEIAIGGGALFTTLDGSTSSGGSMMAEVRAGTRSGLTVSLGLNADFYSNLYRSGDGAKLRALNLFFGLGWKNL